MNRRKFRYLVIFGIASILGLMVSQFYRLYEDQKSRESMFDITIRNAICDVSVYLGSQAIVDLPESYNSKIFQLKHLQYIQYINLDRDSSSNLNNTRLTGALLADHLRRKLRENILYVGNFVFAIYDCDKGLRVYKSLKDGSWEETAGEDDRNLWPVETTVQDVNGKIVGWAGINSSYYGVYLLDLEESTLDSPLVAAGLAILAIACFFAYALYELVRQRKLAEIQRDFIDAMTHEFKTPLATLKLVGEALENPAMSADPVRVKRYAGMLKRETSRLAEQVDTILMSAKDYEHLPDLKMEDIEVAVLISDTLAAFDDRVKQAEMQIKLDCAPGICIRADRPHVMNMLSTLVDNAIKYAGSGCIIRIEASASQGKIVLSVTDNGKGMEARTRRMAGEKFFRARRDADAPKGHGLGLFYVRNMMQNHKGDIKIESEPGTGTTISLIFPPS